MSNIICTTPDARGAIPARIPDARCSKLSSAMFNFGVSMSKSKLWLVSVLCLTCSFGVFGQDSKYSPEGEQIPGPSNQTGSSGSAPPLCCAKGGQEPVSPSAFEKWLSDIQNWRLEHRVRIGY